MKSRTRVAAIVGLVVAGAIVLGAAAHRPLLRVVLARALKAETGLDCSVAGVETSWFPPGLKIADLVVSNPPGFGPQEAVRFNRIVAVVEPLSLFGGRPRLRRLEVAVSNVVVARDRAGRVNWEAIARRPEPTEGGRPEGRAVEPSVTPPPAEPLPAPTVPRGSAQDESLPRRPVVDVLVVRIGAIEVRDPDRAGRPSSPRRLDLGVEHTLTNVTDLSEAGMEIAGVVALRAAPILVGQALREAVVEEGGSLLERLGEEAGRLLKSADPAVTNLLQKGVGELQKILPGLF